MRIPDDAIAELRRRGFVFVERFLDEDERRAALAGFHELYAPPFEHWDAQGRVWSAAKARPARSFPWGHAGLDHVATHPDLVGVAERILGTSAIRLCDASLGMKYPGDRSPVRFHVDFRHNTLGPKLVDPHANVRFFLCLEDVRPGMAPILMVPRGRRDGDARPMFCPGGSLCIYEPLTRHSASPFTAERGARPKVHVGFARADRPWEGGRAFLPKTGGPRFFAAMRAFLGAATPRQRELVGFPPPGDPLWTDAFLAGMVERYPGFDPAPYRAARDRDAV